MMPILAELDRWLAPLGIALLHFLWQGAILALAAWAAITLARSPRVRYAVGCGAMLLMLAAPVATLAWIGPDAPRFVATAPAPVPTDVVDVPRVTDEPARRSEPQTPPTPSASLPAPTLRERLAQLAPKLVLPWLLGVAAVATFHVVGLIRVSRLRRGATPIDDAAWRARLDRLAGRLGLRRAVRLCATVRLDAPAVVGAVRPMILWPAAALTGLTPQQVDALLAHELAHVRRHDYLVNLAQVVVETLLFYHPAVWWLGRRVRAEREHCCDDLAADAIGDRHAYAGALAAMETLRAAPSPALGAKSNGGDGPLLARVRRLVAPSPAAGVGRLALLLQLVTLGLVVALLTLRPRGDDAAGKSADAPLAPGDRVTVSLYDAEAGGARRALVRVVAADGAIDVPPHGRVRVEGLAPADVPRAIDQAASRAFTNIKVKTFASVDAVERGAATPPSAAPPATGPTTRPDYRLAPGDLLRVEVMDLGGGGAKETFVKRVGGSGQITAPYLKPFSVLGLTEIEAEQLILRRYREEQILANATVSVLAIQRSDGLNVPAEAFGLPPARGGAQPTADAPAPAAPIPDKVGVGDLVRVRVADLASVGLTSEFLKRVAADGTITMPYLKKPLPAAGQTPAELERGFSKAYADAQVLTNAGIDVLVVALADGRTIVPDAALAATGRDDDERQRDRAAMQTLQSEVERLKRERAQVQTLQAELDRLKRDGTAGRQQQQATVAQLQAELARLRADAARTPTTAPAVAEPAPTTLPAATIAPMPSTAPAATPPPAARAGPRLAVPPTIRALAARDPGLAKLLAARDDAVPEYVARRASDGPGSASIQSLRQKIETLDAAIDEYADAINGADAADVGRNDPTLIRLTEARGGIVNALDAEVAARGLDSPIAANLRQNLDATDRQIAARIETLRGRTGTIPSSSRPAEVRDGDVLATDARQVAWADAFRPGTAAARPTTRIAEPTGTPATQPSTRPAGRTGADAAAPSAGDLARSSDADPEAALARLIRANDRLAVTLRYAAAVDEAVAAGRPSTQLLDVDADGRIELLPLHAGGPLPSTPARRSYVVAVPVAGLSPADAARTIGSAVSAEGVTVRLASPAAATTAPTSSPAAGPLAAYRDLASRDLTLAVLIARHDRLETPLRIVPPNPDAIIAMRGAIDDQMAARAAKVERGEADDNDLSRRYRDLQASREGATPERRAAIDAQLAALVHGPGEYYVGGHARRPGVYSLGRAVTLKQALTAAGLDAADAAMPRDAAGDAWIDVVFRGVPAEGVPAVGEAILRVALADVMAGRHDDVVMMPDDQLMVGVNVAPATRPATAPAAGADRTESSTGTSSAGAIEWASAFAPAPPRSEATEARPRVADEPGRVEAPAAASASPAAFPHATTRPTTAAAARTDADDLALVQLLARRARLDTPARAGVQPANAGEVSLAAMRAALDAAIAARRAAPASDDGDGVAARFRALHAERAALPPDAPRRAAIDGEIARLQYGDLVAGPYEFAGPAFTRPGPWGILGRTTLRDALATARLDASKLSRDANGDAWLDVRVTSRNPMRVGGPGDAATIRVALADVEAGRHDDFVMLPGDRVTAASPTFPTAAATAPAAAAAPAMSRAPSSDVDPARPTVREELYAARLAMRRDHLDVSVRADLQPAGWPEAAARARAEMDRLLRGPPRKRQADPLDGAFARLAGERGRLLAASPVDATRLADVEARMAAVAGAGDVSINGAVARPGYYGLTGRTVTLTQVARAAGIEPAGDGDLWLDLTVRVYEASETPAARLRFSWADLTGGRTPDVALVRGDAIAVSRTSGPVQSNMPPPAAPTYERPTWISPGDRLSINFGSPQREARPLVDADGNVTIDGLGTFRAAGKRTGAFVTEVNDRYLELNPRRAGVAFAGVAVDNVTMADAPTTRAAATLPARAGADLAALRDASERGRAAVESARKGRSVFSPEVERAQAASRDAERALVEALLARFAGDAAPTPGADAMLDEMMRDEDLVEFLKAEAAARGATESVARMAAHAAVARRGWTRASDPHRAAGGNDEAAAHDAADARDGVDPHAAPAGHDAPSPTTRPAVRIDAHDGRVHVASDGGRVEAESITLTPTTAPAAAADAIVVGDLVRVTVYALTGPDKATIVVKRVAADGTITLPHLDAPVALAGVAPAAAERAVARAYAEARVLARAQVDVVVVQSADGRLTVPAGVFGGQYAAGATAAGDAVADPSATGATADGATTRAEATTRPAVPDVRALAARDPYLARLVATRDDVEAELARLRTIHGRGSPMVVKLESNLQALDARIADLAAAMVRDAPTTGPTTAPAADLRALAERDPFFARLLRTRDDMEAQLAQVRAIHGRGSPTVAKLEENLRALDAQVATLTAAVARDGPATAPTTAPTTAPAAAVEAEVRAIGANDLLLGGLIRTRDEMDLELLRLPQVQGRGSPAVAKLEASRQGVDEQIDRLVADLASSAALRSGDPAHVAALRAERDRAAAELERARQSQGAASPAVVRAEGRLAALEAIVARAAGEPDLRALAAREPLLARMLRTRDDLDLELSRLRATHGPGWPAVQTLEANRRALVAQIKGLAEAVTREAAMNREAATTAPAANAGA